MKRIKKENVLVGRDTTENYECEIWQVGALQKFNCPDCGDYLEIKRIPGRSIKSDCSCDDKLWVSVG